VPSAVDADRFAGDEIRVEEREHGLDDLAVAALVGAKRTAAKARASRANGRMGGRPPKDVTKRRVRTKASR
jgi:hypothetical protein